MIRTLFFVALSLLFSLAAQADLSQLPDKASTDQSEYRTMVLESGLRVILLSDPDLNKSSASIAVGVGSYGDPEDRAGLAHFLEHMLFLGTQKYPDEAEYSNYLRSNGGYGNAYTSGDHTNYHFEINHDAFEGALDRFAQFFIAPLFTADYTEREMNAVDSEFEKNLESDVWRAQQMFRTMVRDGHPEHHFSIGNLDTLSDIERAEFIDFYERFYSADLMALALTSTASLDQMEAWVREYFASIQNRQQTPIEYAADLVDTKQPAGLVLFEPVSDRRVLQLVFPTTGTRDLYRSKPAELIGFLLGYEGKGSLLSKLKQQGLATGLSGGAYPATRDYSLFSIDVELTLAGAENWQQVMESTFAYINVLRDAEFPEYLFEERATVARLEELYSDKGEGASRALTLARNALHYPLEDAARVRYIWKEPSPGMYFEVLDAVRPDNMIAMLEMKGVPTDRKERYFGVEYSIQPFAPDLMATLEDPGNIDGLRLPAPNPFIPTQVDLLAPRPVKIIDEPGIVLYYAQDTTFERPRVSYQIRIRLPESLSEAEAAVKRELYVDVVNEMLNEQLYTAAVAGLQATINDTARGIRIGVSGYNQSANSFLDSVLARMPSPELSAERFEALKERKLRQWRNAVFLDAYRQAFELERKYLYEHYMRPAEKLAAAENVDLGDIRRFTRTLFKRGNVEIVAYGNVTQQQAAASARTVVQSLDLAPVPSRNVFDIRLLALDSEGPVIAANKLIVNNSAYVHGVLLGSATAPRRAGAMMLRNFISEPYYSAMRTRQQLGYIVASFMTETENKLYARFLIQSADYTASELRQRSEEFVMSLPQLFDELPDEKLEVIRNGVRAELEEQDKSVAERAARYFNLAFDKEADWDRTDATLAALDDLTRADLRAMLERLVHAGDRQFTTLSMAEQHAEALEHVNPTMSDVGQWKQSRAYR